MQKGNEFIATYDFKGARFCLREDGILEAFVNAGIEIDRALGLEYAEVLSGMAFQTTGLLVHKKNSYSLTFDGQKVLGHIPNVIATALLAYNHVSKIASISQKPVMGNPEHPVEVFEDYEAALAWLQLQVARHTETESA